MMDSRSYYVLDGYELTRRKEDQVAGLMYEKSVILRAQQHDLASQMRVSILGITEDIYSSDLLLD